MIVLHPTAWDDLTVFALSTYWHRLGYVLRFRRGRWVAERREG